MESASRPAESQNLSQRLVQSVWRMWEGGGHAAISARSLTQEAGVPISTLYNHFASLDHVFLQAQHDALEAARQWCTGQLEQLFAPDHTPADGGLGPIMAALIDEWTQGQRRLAFAWREGFLLAKRDPRYLPHWQGWRALWAGFWQTVCDGCGVGAHGEWTGFVFEAEAALHILSWRRALDRACLEELCAGWATWLDGRLTAEGPWRRQAREQALAAAPDLPIHDEAAHRIAAAAADVVEHKGVARLTHRAVAAEAGVSLGMVSSRFRTSLDLVRAAFETIYRRITTPRDDINNAQSVEQALPGLTGERMNLSHRLAMEEMMLAVARQSDFSPFAPQLRYLRGRTSGRMLQLMAGDAATISPLDAALFSDLVSGMQRAGIGLSPQDKASTGRDHMLRLLRLLGLPTETLG